MEPSKEPISVRVAQLNSKIVSTKVTETKSNLISREGLFDALIVLYDECNTDCLKKHDSHIASFVNKQRGAINNAKASRVNIADFEVKSVVGRGHFGEVHVVKEKQTSDIYAMKTVKKSVFLANKSSTFEEERNIMACSNSPWITSLQYAFQDINHLYFVMEYHPGGDLLCLLHRQGGTIPESAASFYIAELVVAIDDLHSMGYVHRDIKPDNILLDRCGHIKLADFGSSAKLNIKGLVSEGMPVGTPDYIAPEVLQSMDNKINKKSGYNKSCDYWSVGILAYQMIVGNAPFTGQNTTGTYSKIMNYKNNLKFPPDIVLSQAYISLIKALVNDSSVRLNYEQILKHSVFKNIDFHSLRDQVPPYVPKVDSVDDTSNFLDIPSKKSEPNIDNFKVKTHFSGKNLPFVGFTYTHDLHEYQRTQTIPVNDVKKERLEELKKEVQVLQTKLMKNQDLLQEKENLEKKFDDNYIKLESLENLRNRLERDLSNSVAECGSLKRTLELERKDRINLENRALEILKTTKIKWENSEKCKIDSLKLEIAQQSEKIQQLTETNFMLKEQLQHTLKLEHKHKTSLDSVQQLNRQSIVGLESRLERVTTDTHTKISELQSKLSEEGHENIILSNEITRLKRNWKISEDKLKISEENRNEILIKLESNQKLIRELENKITVIEDTNRAIEKEKNKNRVLEEEITKLKNNEKVELLTRELTMERNLLATVKDEVKVLKNELNISSKNYQTLAQQQRDTYVKQIEELKKQLNEKTDEKSRLEISLQEFTTKDVNNKLRVQTLEDLLQRLESGVSKLETDGKKDHVLVEQVERLEQQLVQVHESAALEKQELVQLKAKFWRIEKDLSNAEIDKRIFKRELKEAEDQIKSLTSEIEALKSQIAEKTKIHESSVTQLGEMNEQMADEVMKLQNILMAKDKEIEKGRKTISDETSNANQFKMKINQCQQEIATLTKNMEVLKSEKLELGHKTEQLQTDRDRLQKEKYMLNDQEQSVQSKLQEYKKNYQSLRETCTLLEGQVVEYEKIVESYKSREKLSNANIDRLIQELDDSKGETQKTKCLVNEEISLKLTAQTKLKRLAEQLDILDQECSSYKDQNDIYRQDCQSLSEQLCELEEKVNDQNATLKTYERQISTLKLENHNLKEETSTRLTQLNNLQDSHYQLTQHLADYKQAVSELRDNLQQIEETSRQQTNFHKEREIKSTATVEQQIKLIDLLQSQLAEYKKKKNFCEKLFKGNKKENQPPTNVALNYREIEVMLTKQKELNKELSEENRKLKASSLKYDKKIDNLKSHHSINAPLSPQTKLTLERLTQSPNELDRQVSVRRMYHNIPHRFETKLCTRTIKCAHCSQQIALGRNEKYCTECHVIVHVNCAKNLPKTCGVPKALVKHYSNSISKIPVVENVSEISLEDVESVDVATWVKVPVRGNTGWDKRYACLTSKTLKLYAQPPEGTNIAPIKTIPLQESNYRGQVIADPVSSEISIPMANSDLPFLIKVDFIPETTCWPPKNIIVMALNVEDKEKWLKALQSIFHGTEEKYKGDVILQHNQELQVNCVVDLNNTKLLGTEKGLYSYSNNTLLHIEGLSKVYQITVLKHINLVVMIVNSSRYIITCDLNHLITLTECAQCSKPTLTFKVMNINNLEYFHLFQTSKTKPVKMAIATSKQLILLNFDHETFEFKVAKVLDTAEPTSCILFTEHSVIVGADKFFEIDLKSFAADEFLDASDQNLSQAVACYQMRSFPLAILQVSNNPIEYLLCFHEYAFFVDEFGQCSRKSDIKWSRLPLAFYFSSPLLYVVQFTSIEIFKISGETCNVMKNSVESLLNVESIKIELNNPRYLGNGKKGIYVSLPGEICFIKNEGSYQRLSINTDITDESLSSGSVNGEEDSSEFSFTSSMVQSLDGHLSDQESECLEDGFTSKRKVTFSHINTEL